MKKSFLILLSIVILASCANEQSNNNSETSKDKVVENTNVYGETIIVEKVADVRRLPMLMDSVTELNVKLIGKVNTVCQMSGCWLDIDMGNDQLLHVVFKDESFVIPKDIAGKTVIIEGIATSENIPVEMQKKIAADEGKSQNEIDAINSPITEYSFEAKGLIIK